MQPQRPISLHSNLKLIWLRAAILFLATVEPQAVKAYLVARQSMKLPLQRS